MPIEITEMVVRATVSQNTTASGAPSTNAATTANQDAQVQMQKTVREVMSILKRKKNER